MPRSTSHRMSTLAFAAAALMALPILKGEDPKHDYFTTSDGVKIHYITMGDHGSWVVLIHGFSDSAQRMFFSTGIAPALAKNHRVVAIDNRNHGMSDKPQLNGPGRALDTIELMDHLKIEKAHIGGYSMGGAFTGSLLAKAIPNASSPRTSAAQESMKPIRSGSQNCRKIIPVQIPWKRS